MSIRAHVAVRDRAYTPTQATRLALFRCSGEHTAYGVPAWHGRRDSDALHVQHGLLN